MQNPPLVLGSVVTEDIADMIRFIFNVHLDVGKRVQWKYQIKMEGEKNCSQKPQNASCKEIYTTFKVGHTRAPYGVRTQRHAEGYQPEGEDPQIATEEIHTACTGS